MHLIIKDINPDQTKQQNTEYQLNTKHLFSF